MDNTIHENSKICTIIIDTSYGMRCLYADQLCIMIYWSDRGKGPMDLSGFVITIAYVQ